MQTKKLCITIAGLMFSAVAANAMAAMTTLVPNIKGFNALNLHDSGKVMLRQGNRDAISIQVPQRAVPYMNVYRSGKTLNLGMKDHPFHLVQQPIYTITMRHIQGLTDSNSGKIHVLTPVQTQRLSIALHNSGFINMQSVQVDGPAAIILHNSGHFYASRLQAKNTSVYLANSGSVRIDHLRSDQLSTTIHNSGHVRLNQGSVQQENLSMTNSGVYMAHGVSAKHASVVMRNSGHATLTVNGSMSIRKRGSGQLFIYGRPRIDRFNINNSSGIHMMD